MTFFKNYQCIPIISSRLILWVHFGHGHRQNKKGRLTSVCMSVCLSVCMFVLLFLLSLTRYNVTLAGSADVALLGPTVCRISTSKKHAKSVCLNSYSNQTSEILPSIVPKYSRGNIRNNTNYKFVVWFNFSVGQLIVSI